MGLAEGIIDSTDVLLIITLLTLPFIFVTPRISDPNQMHSPHCLSLYPVKAGYCVGVALNKAILVGLVSLAPVTFS